MVTGTVYLNSTISTSFAETNVNVQPCKECFTNNLGPEQLTALLTLLDNRDIQSLESLCELLSKTPNNSGEFNQILKVITVIPNISEIELNNILDCLESS